MRRNSAKQWQGLSAQRLPAGSREASPSRNPQPKLQSDQVKNIGEFTFSQVLSFKLSMLEFLFLRCFILIAFFIGSQGRLFSRNPALRYLQETANRRREMSALLFSRSTPRKFLTVNAPLIRRTSVNPFRNR